MPTVTLQRARPGRRSVEVDGVVFPLGDPVRDVSDATVKRLKEMPGVTVHVSPGAKKTTEPAPEEE